MEAPVVPSLTLPTLRVGDSVDNLSIGTAEGIEISISGLPSGLDNVEPFAPRNVKRFICLVSE